MVQVKRDESAPIVSDMVDENCRSETDIIPDFFLIIIYSSKYLQAKSLAW